MLNKKVLVAISGGVDSAMTASLLKEAGFEVQGVYFLLHQSSAGQIEKVRLLAEKLEIKLNIKDISKSFEKQVINYFVNSYEQNNTPNPCVICNPTVKFHGLIKTADELGIEKVATGHYAKVREMDNKFFLAKAEDQNKDQSYFLYRLSENELKRVIFPLGDYQKIKIKKMAQQAGLPVEQSESQDVCFFSKDETLQSFLQKRISPLAGNIEDENGKVLGRHKGLVFYTQGQRYGLGLSGGPYYAIDKDEKRAALIVSKNQNHEKLLVSEIKISDTHWTSEKPPLGKTYAFRSRYKVKETSGEFFQANPDGSYLVKLSEPQWAVASGQSLVAYDNEIVVGGGIID